MSGICVSIGTDDGIHVKVGHFGDSKYFYHYRLGGGDIILEKVVENPYRGEHGHGHGHGRHTKREKIYELNKDCNVIVATFFGPGGEAYMNERGIRVVKVAPGTEIKTILEKLATETQEV
ncbi:MAG: NifB/NifX family molybdenum-iron cluster-binding protein [Desulfurococcales archaeon]|nr:NifB/NifX family molybdenum-iron cluster-binding protein [Desulfurococcales archaeon]MCE4622015.1 NifB/NifX family molybdenum-iron cluster-binding protein [Desulfurococcales archaeon]MCE4629938.1 NifB/NifX family molybdenum-iron cluster-binding protein [Desulfurococcales archaeon]